MTVGLVLKTKKKLIKVEKTTLQLQYGGSKVVLMDTLADNPPYLNNQSCCIL